MDCGSCGQVNPESARFCGACGASLARSVRCDGCGTANPAGQRFCHECGANLTEPSPSARHTEPVGSGAAPGRGERKQVTVLFADVAGSMALASRMDPE